MRNVFKNKPLLILIVAIILLAALALATSGTRTVSVVESAVGAVVQPVQGFASRASDSIIGFFRRVFASTDADKENEQLRAYIAQLEEAQSGMEELRQENDRLKNLLHYVEDDTDSAYVTARVIGMSQSVWFDVFTINAGRNHGISEDMPVLCADGLIGRVTDVAATYSKVTSIIDPSSSISVMVQRTRDNAMARGLFNPLDDNQLELYFLPSGGDLVPGDVIVTNGLGGVFPRGVTVGTVREVTRATDEASGRNAILEPAVDFRYIEEVMVMVDAAAQGEE